MSGSVFSHYQPHELARLQAAIACLGGTAREYRERVAQAVGTGDCPAHLAPFWFLTVGAQSDTPGDIAAGRELFRKLESDDCLEQYGFYCLFPELYHRIYQLGHRPDISFNGRTRGRVALFKFGPGDGMVVKPLQSRREGTIARIAGDAGVGPAQLPSVDGFLTEELVEGRFFTELPAEILSEELAFRLGSGLGEQVARLHQANVHYNDATLSDPSGRSHLIVQLSQTGEGTEVVGLRLIDYGVSVLLDNFPNLEMEEVYNLARTTPEFRFLSRTGIGGADMGNFLGQYRQRLAGLSREEILVRDLRFTHEGLIQAARILGSHIIGPFREGFEAAYGGALSLGKVDQV